MPEDGYRGDKSRRPASRPARMQQLRRCLCFSFLSTLCCLAAVLVVWLPFLPYAYELYHHLGNAHAMGHIMEAFFHEFGRDAALPVHSTAQARTASRARCRMERRRPARTCRAHAYAAAHTSHFARRSLVRSTPGRSACARATPSSPPSLTPSART
eukprot:6950613-Prymnesium_polylepis.1